MDFKTIPELFQFVIDHYQRPDLLNYREENTWKKIPTQEFADTVLRISLGLIELGVKKGEKVGIISNPSPFWVMADFAISIAGGVTVPIFRRISPENLAFEIEDSSLSIVFIGDENEYEPAKQYGKGLRKIITIGFEKDAASAISFEKLAEMGAKTLEKDTGLRKRPLAMPGENELFTVIYTSGSMGRPKGVMLSHKNIVSQVHAAAKVFEIARENDLALSSLPLSHIFERMVMYFYLSQGVAVYFADDINRIGDYVRELRPTIMTVVPRLLEKILAKMQQKAEEEKGLKRIIATAAIRRAESKDTNGRTFHLIDRLYEKLVYAKFMEALGGRFRYVISGAASLPLSVGRFFLNIGLPLFEGYGMTEASPVIAANNKLEYKLGTVGKPFPDVIVRIGEDGEVLAKGPNVMSGYLNNPEETSRSLDAEGFLHTGDLGKLDTEGFLTITGRKKELFKKSTGEYVPPVPIEQALTKLDIIEMAVVIAEGRKFVSCLLFPNIEAAERLKKKQGFDNVPVDKFLAGPFIKKYLDDYIKEINKHLHHTEEVQKYTLISKPISIETGEITPTLKVRRGVIEQEFRKEIDAMYREDNSERGAL